MKTIKEIYQQHAEIPYIAPQFAEELTKKPIPKRNMERTEEGLLPGHIIMLWRIGFGTYHTQHPHHKYFYTSYGIDAQKELEWLIEQGYVRIQSAFESLRFLSAGDLKDFLRAKGVKGLSKMKRSELDQAMQTSFKEQDLANLYDLRGYQLTDQGQKMLAKHQEIVQRHPQKKF